MVGARGSRRASGCHRTRRRSRPKRRRCGASAESRASRSGWPSQGGQGPLRRRAEPGRRLARRRRMRQRPRPLRRRLQRPNRTPVAPRQQGHTAGAALLKIDHLGMGAVDEGDASDVAKRSSAWASLCIPPSTAQTPACSTWAISISVAARRRGRSRNRWRSVRTAVLGGDRRNGRPEPARACRRGGCQQGVGALPAYLSRQAHWAGLLRGQKRVAEGFIDPPRLAAERPVTRGLRTAAKAPMASAVRECQQKVQPVSVSPAWRARISRGFS